MMELDPPDHTRLRRLVQSGFTPKVTATYEPAFRKLFNITRQPNPHVTFGTGRHKCLGASLAQLEVRVFFEEFLDRVARFEVGEPDLDPTSSGGSSTCR